MTEHQASTPAEYPSPYAFDATLQRVTQAIVTAGMQIFATIDHAANAREAGLTMAPGTVLIYGKAAGGTPIMQAVPLAALDLPLRVLIYETAAGQTMIAAHPIAPMLIAASVPEELAARLEPAEALLLKAIAS